MRFALSSNLFPLLDTVSSKKRITPPSPQRLCCGLGVFAVVFEGDKRIFNRVGWGFFSSIETGQ